MKPTKYPASITAAAMHAHIARDRAWAATLDEIGEPLMVTGTAQFESSNITHLSRWLVFTGTADFTRCRYLKKAAGTFHHSVSFEESGIEEIDPDFESTWDNGDPAANFRNCYNLTVARGNFAGLVDFSGAVIHTIDRLRCRKAWFIGCPDIRRIDQENREKLSMMPIINDDSKTLIVPGEVFLRLSREEKARKALKHLGDNTLEL